MKKLITATLMAASTLGAIAQQANPLLETWNTPRQTPPFESITNEHYVPAIKQLVDEARQEVRVIYLVRSVPTFENTIEALERSGAKLTRALGVFYNLLGSNTNDTLQQIALELSPILTEYSNDISLNPELFARVKQVYDRRAELTLTTEQAKLLDNTYKGFVRSGANLQGQDKDKYRKISTELSELGLKFDQNELAATNDFTILVDDVAELKGMPQWALDAAAADAKAKDKTGYLLTLQAPSYMPLMTYCENRELREKMWSARASLCYGGQFDNQDIVKRIANLRLEMANLLGFKTYAHYVLEERMAQSIDKVYALENELLTKTKATATGDVEMVRQYAVKKGFQGDLKRWDFDFWSEKYKQDQFAITDDMTRPYFKLENCEKAIFMLAGKLYGLTFKENNEISTCHPDARAFEVFDQNGDFLSVLYIDYFPRDSKQSGAWMNTYREAYTTVEGTSVRPIVTLVCNFTKPTSERPSLLSFDEVTTLLHEFGHGLHGMLAKGNYSSLTGTNVYRDFVELPSQIMENWATEKEFLDLFAVHYKTGKKIPAKLVDKIIASKNYLAAYLNMNQLTYGLNDLAWHTLTTPYDGSVRDMELKATEQTTIIPVPEGMCRSTSFGHIFAGGYAAGYYSYKWAEVLEADAFNQFKKHGIFDKATAAKFRALLEAGGTEHPMALYVRFAGAEPTVEPLLEKMGIRLIF